MDDIDRHVIDFIVVNNQVALMRALATLVNQNISKDLHNRVSNVKLVWQHCYNEDIEYSTPLGDVGARPEKT